MNISRKQRLFVLFIFIFSAGVFAIKPQPPEGFHTLLKGKDFTGWHEQNPHPEQSVPFSNHWKIENSELINDGHGFAATTDASYENIELLLEYKTVPQAESDLYLRGTPQIKIWNWDQIFDPTQPTYRPYLGSGGLFNNNPSTLGRDPDQFADKPFGERNQLRILLIGDRIWIWLNQRPVVIGAVMENTEDHTQPLPASGPIRLQTHGGEMRWRNLFIRTIDEEEAVLFLSKNSLVPNPTLYNISYGSHPKQLLHFWKVPSNQPTPALIFIHGGGWMNGGRLDGLTASLLPEMLNAGISVVSITYRFIPEAMTEGETPPVKGPLHDAARALQFVRSHAHEWNIDPQRIGISGTSAGACSCLWLTFHPDLADPNSTDPIARESTRPWCTAVRHAQTSLDPLQMKVWTPNNYYGGHAFGFSDDKVNNRSTFDVFLEKRDTILPWIAEYSPYSLVSSNAPPIHLFYSRPPALGQPQKDPTHTSNFGVKLQEHCRKFGVPCELVYPGAPDVKHPTTSGYLIEKLTENPRSQPAIFSETNILKTNP